MSTDILDFLTSSFSGPLVRQASSFLGESETGTQSAVRSIGPTLLAGALQKVTIPGGAGDLMRTIKSDSVDASLGGRLSDVLGNRTSLEPLLSRGEPLANALLGTRTGGATHAIAEVAGIKPSSVTSLLSMAAPVLFGFLKNKVTQGRLDTVGLTNLLLGQRGSLERAGLDPRISSALGFGSLSNLLSSLPGASTLGGTAGAASAAAPEIVPARAHGERKGKWVPWAVAAGAAVLAMFLWNNFSARKNAERTAMVTQAEPESAGTAERLRMASLPAKVYFEVGVADLGGADRQKLAALASTIRAGGGTVVVTGYTDRSGSPDQNLELAKDRASAVRDALVAEGVAETSIVMEPPTFVTGTGADEEARRVEITSR